MLIASMYLQEYPVQIELQLEDHPRDDLLDHDWTREIKIQAEVEQGPQKTQGGSSQEACSEQNQ